YLVEHDGGFREMTCSARYGGAICRKALCQLRQYRVTQVVALEMAVGVALVFDPLEPTRLRIVEDFLPRHIEQGAQNRGRKADRGRMPGALPLRLSSFAFSLPQRRHRREPFHPRTSKELQEQGLDLVVLMVRERHVVAGLAGEHRVSRGARGRLDALAL